jgi:rSAM/selenodomain-associated transferase 1
MKSLAQDARGEVVLVFARAPTRGAVKTRLAATVGDDAALAVYRWLAERTLRALGGPARTWTLRALVAGDVEALGGWRALVDEVRSQRGGDLGARMAAAMGDALREGYARVVIVGTDCPTLDAARVRAALQALREAPAVIGPALDGGYYLLGGSAPLPVFDGVPWSTAVVADETRARLARAGLPWRELSAEPDIDRAEDLAHLASREDCPDWIRALASGGA